MMIFSSVEDLKDKMMKRQSLASKRNNLMTRVVDGKNFFAQQTKRTSPGDLYKGAMQLVKYLDEIEQIDKEIFDLDAVIACRLEAEFLDSIVKVRTRRSQNEAGDTIRPMEFFFLPEDFNAADTQSVSENDLWFLKIAKSAFSVQNIEIIKKGELH